MKQFQHEGRTILLVTHAADLVRQICDRAAVLDHGRARRARRRRARPSGAFREHLHAGRRVERERRSSTGAAGRSTRHAAPRVAPEERRRRLGVRITDVEIEHPGRADRPYLLPGEPLTIRVGYDATERDRPTSSSASRSTT